MYVIYIYIHSFSGSGSNLSNLIGHCSSSLANRLKYHLQVELLLLPSLVCALLASFLFCFPPPPPPPPSLSSCALSSTRLPFENGPGPCWSLIMRCERQAYKLLAHWPKKGQWNGRAAPPLAWVNVVVSSFFLPPSLHIALLSPSPGHIQEST